MQAQLSHKAQASTAPKSGEQPVVLKDKAKLSTVNAGSTSDRANKESAKSSAKEGHDFVGIAG